jgi:hypothetical protein
LIKHYMVSPLVKEYRATSTDKKEKK